jgi:hypothetical protein
MTYFWVRFTVKPSNLPAMSRKYLLSLVFSILALAAGAQTNYLPPGAQPGKCYANCFIPDQYQSMTEQVVSKAETERLIAQPAVLHPATRQLVIKEEARRLLPYPAEFQTVTEQVVVREASKRYVLVPAEYETNPAPGSAAVPEKRLVIVPAEFRTDTLRIAIKEETRRYIAEPAEYETVNETYEIEPAYTRFEVFEPKFETRTDRIVTKPAGMQWIRRKADPNCLQGSADDCFVWCLVDVPAEYQTVVRRVNLGCDGTGTPDAGCLRTIPVPAKTAPVTVRKVKKAARVREEVIPGEYKTLVRQVLVKAPEVREETVTPAAGAPVRVVKKQATVREELVPAEYLALTRQVIKTPPGFREEVIPAEYKTVSVKELKSPAATRSEIVPAEYATITRRVLEKPGGFTEWREVLCGERITGYTIGQIQRALKERGYYQGPIDNQMGGKTKTSLTKFQQDRGLPVGNLDFETLNALGIKY